ncbi:hypothetical protein KI688_006330 [Linnemannia hyalina]|uniref:FAD-binding domain-containing protein n=1 Tax=Linnemannia hyalina TaxID=64524 RepID=A0A9P7Y638_9FUNG|nr:hypothetical protein KI688_006330 [Linnemannia hyalina]
MPPAQFKVIIAGGGIAGLSLGVMLERAGIDYIILEAAGEVRPLGAVVYLGPPVLRAFEQLGLLEDLIRHANFMTGVTLMDHKLNKICRINVDYAKERYGYDTLTIFRAKLYSVLLSRIPAYKILFAKRVASTVQSSEGVKVQCEDGSTYNGDILVAADGGSSPIRKAMYTEIKKRTKKVFHPQDYALPKLDQRCIVGVTEPLSMKEYPILASKECELILVMPRDSNCMTWWIPMEGRRFGWGITSPMPSANQPSKTKKKKEESKSNGLNHLREATTDTTTSSSFDMTHSLSSTHESASPGHRQFSSLSGTSYSPPSSNSSSSIHGGYSSNVHIYNNGGGGSDNGISSSSNITTSALAVGTNNHLDLKKRQSFGRLSKISTSSSNSSQTNFQKYPPVLVSANSNILTPPLKLKDLPNDRTWSSLDTQYGIDESIREQASPFGGTFGDMIDMTSRKNVTMCVVEEKFYNTWHFGRTILLGDSCHKLLPSSGHGTTQAVLDSISLASLLYDLPSNSATDIEALFRIQFERRGPAAKAAVIASQQQDQLLFNRKLSGKFIRKMASNFVSDKIKIKLGDKLFDARPVLPFLKQVPSRGHAKNTDKTDVPLTQDKRFEVARRKSISSGYLTSGSGSGGSRSRRGSFDYGSSSGDRDRREVQAQGNGRSLDMTFEPPNFPYSTSMPSVVLPGGTMLPKMPMTRPMSPMMDIEGTLIPMLSRPPEKHPYKHQQDHNPGHWNLYQ